MHVTLRGAPQPGQWRPRPLPRQNLVPWPPARARIPEPETLDAGNATYSVTLPSFEGPLDLLLHLCQKHELDILDIPIGFVTEKYLEYLALMQLASARSGSTWRANTC